MLAAAVMLAVAVATPARPGRWVEDHAGLISSTTRAELDASLEAHEKRTGHQVVVWIGKDTGGAPLDEWANRTFASWKLGRAGKDDGLALFVLAGERAVAIEVGYGLEGAVPDAIAARVIREVMAPKLAAGDADGALRDGVDAILAAIGDEPSATHWRPSTPEVIGGGIVMILFIILFIKNPRLALWLLTIAITRRAPGGGGFRPGGGRSGGAGARGHW